MILFDQIKQNLFCCGSTLLWCIVSTSPVAQCTYPSHQSSWYAISQHPVLYNAKSLLIFVFVGAKIILSVSSQPIHLSVTETPYFNCSSLLGIAWLPSCKLDSSIIPTIDVLPSNLLNNLFKTSVIYSLYLNFHDCNRWQLSGRLNLFIFFHKFNIYSIEVRLTVTTS